MKEFLNVEVGLARCRTELDELRTLLDSKGELSERHDVQPLFRRCTQLAAFIGTMIPDIGPADRLAYEFPVFGDYTADIVIGNAARGAYCAIELEDARANSVFTKLPGRASAEWGRRLEHGFGQLVDWFFAFDDHRNTAGFAKHFGYGHVEFSGALIIGRTKDVPEHELRRLRWRSSRVTINTHKIYCRTYDELYEALNHDWRVLARPLDPPAAGTAPADGLPPTPAPTEGLP